MKSKFMFLGVLLVGLFLFTQCQKEEETLPFDQDQYTKAYGEQWGDGWQSLWAGAAQNDLSKGTLVGKVYWEITDDILTVTYATDYPWFLTEVHLWVGREILQIPNNAAPGQFPYKKSGLDYLSSYVFTIDLFEAGLSSYDKLYVAAHAVVEQPNQENLKFIQPIDINFNPVFFKNVSDPRSYFHTTIDGGPLAGEYESYCADSWALMNHGNFNQGTAYLSSNLPDDIFFYQQNLPKVNWVLNYDFVGEIFEGEEVYTFGDVQKAIWILLEEEPKNNPLGGVGDFDMKRVEKIVELAHEFGEGFVPVCGQKLLIVILLPGQQTSLITLPVPCKQDETAWAFGAYPFSSKYSGKTIANKWGWIFKIDNRVTI